MKNTGILFTGLMAVVLLGFVFVWSGSLKDDTAQPDAAVWQVTTTALGSDEGVSPEAPAVATAGDEQLPNWVSAADVGPMALPTEIPGETLVYFVPTDSDSTGTVVFLYNTESTTQTVAVRGYSYNGVLGYSLSVAVGPDSLLRLTSDSVAAAPPPSWATPAPIVTNFTDFTYLASLSLPRGVKAEGYTFFNPGTGTLDPRLDQGAIPLRFSTDPDTLFMPAVHNSP